MKNIIKKWNFLPLLLLLLLLLLPGILALSSLGRQIQAVPEGALGEGKPYGAYYVLIEAGNDRLLWDSVYEGARKEGESSDAYVEYFGKNLTADYTISDKLRMAIDAGVDGIILNGDGTEEVEKLVEEAGEKGIPVVTALDDSVQSLRVCFVGVNNYNLGREYGNLVWEILSQNQRDARVAVLVDSDFMDTGRNTLFLGLREILDERAREADWKAEIETETVSIDSSNAFMAEETIRNLLVNEATQPDILICMSETDTRRAYEAVVDYIKVGQVSILGYYESGAILSAIEKDIIFSTVAVDGEQLGRFCVQALTEYRNSGRVNEYFPVDIYVIRRENVEQYLMKYRQ